MSTREKQPKGLEDCDAIKDLLLKIKPKLHDSKSANRDSLIADLEKIASLAQSVTEKRPKYTEKWAALAESLDHEGVFLWNLSTGAFNGADNEEKKFVAALRLAAFRLVEAGLEKDPDIETILHVVQIASKTASTLSELGNKSEAASALTCAAKFEESLRTIDDPKGLHEENKASATIVYLSVRMEAAWREGNVGVAHFMLQKITDDSKRLSLLPARDRERLAAKILDIGQSLLRGHIQEHATDSGHNDAQESVRWIQKAFAIIEHLEDSATPGIVDLKRAILRSLARAYFFSASHDKENLSRAEAALQELIKPIEASHDYVNPECQELRWMRLAVLKHMNAGESMLFEAFKAIVDHMDFTESTVTDLLLELRTLAQYQNLITSINEHVLQRALRTGNRSGRFFIDRLLLSLIICCSKDKDHSRAMKSLQTSLKCVLDADLEIPKLAAVACITLLWQYGGRLYQSKKLSEAAEWFLAGSHALFASLGKQSQAKCSRKAALCYIEQNEYSKASAVIRTCPSTEAATHYLILLMAVDQGLEDEAVQALRDVTRAPDFDRRMLQLATQLAHKAGMNLLLLAALEALLETLKTSETLDDVVDAVTLIRCTIRHILRLLAQPTSNKPHLVESLIKHFATAKSLVADAESTQATPLIIKDLSWLWRTAYNSAVQGCSEWEHAESKVSEMFDLSRELMEVFCKATMTDGDSDTLLHVANASFASISAQVFAIRQTVIGAGEVEGPRLETLLEHIKLGKSRIDTILKRNILWEEDDSFRMKSFLCGLWIFEVELLCRLKEWKRVLSVIREVVTFDATSVTTFEAIADMLWAEKDCPTDVLSAVLEAILHATLDRGALSLDKFSRWLRAICTILLSRNGSVDREKALSYIEQAVTVLQDQKDVEEISGESYPLDERNWLLSTSYNTGLECLHASLLAESKRWFECSTIVCRFIPDGEKRSAKISETYKGLLARYVPDIQ